eukprot:3315840-Prymnesium_polylepis.1
MRRVATAAGVRLRAPAHGMPGCRWCRRSGLLHSSGAADPFIQKAHERQGGCWTLAGGAPDGNAAATARKPTLTLALHRLTYPASGTVPRQLIYARGQVCARGCVHWSSPSPMPTERQQSCARAQGHVRTVHNVRSPFCEDDGGSRVA